MKARFSREYWESRWDEFMVVNYQEHYMNLEGMLSNKMECLEGLPITEEQRKGVAEMFAKIIADDAAKALHKDMETLKAIDAGEASWGYTTEFQEIQFDRRFRDRFEFNCYQLSKFKAKYVRQG